MTEIQIKKIENENKKLKEKNKEVGYKNTGLLNKIRSLERITKGYEEKIADLEAEKIQFFEVNGSEKLKNEIENLKEEILNIKDNRNKDITELQNEIADLNTDNIKLLANKKELETEKFKAYEIIDKLNQKLACKKELQVENNTMSENVNKDEIISLSDIESLKLQVENKTNEIQDMKIYIKDIEHNNNRLSDKLKYIKSICFDLIIDEGE